MIIAIVHENKAFLPEAGIYCSFFEQYNIECLVVNKDELGLAHRHVEWRFMGSDLSKPKEGILKIHEFCSASMPPWSSLKNWSKSFFNTQPDFRLFLNEYVKKAFNFHDRIPSGYRDMGVPEEWLLHAPAPAAKEYDFVYAGDCSPFREPEQMLNCFTRGSLKDRSLLVVGNKNPELENVYGEFKNISFVPPVPYIEIPHYLHKARFGFNFIVDKEPINRQTSTKLLDYAACRLPVVSTDYQWARQFQERHGGRFLFVQPDLSDFTWENVNRFDYAAPNLSQLTWEKQIRGSGVLEFLQSKFPGLKFD